MTTHVPNFNLEQQAIATYGKHVAGVDEAGRGPLAGPVVAAAVILDAKNIPDGIDDSKRLSETKRQHLFQILPKIAYIGIGIGDVKRIDRDNILNATLWAMKEAIEQLAIPPDSALIDGNKCPTCKMPCQAVIKGDSRSLSIAGASIIAKVTRDKIMTDLDQQFPHFGWAQNKGYGTKAHKSALLQYGITPHHRRSFKPIYDRLKQS